MKQKVNSALSADEIKQLKAFKKEIRFNLAKIFKAFIDGISVVNPEDLSIVDDYIVFIAKFADGWGISTLKGMEFLFNEYGKSWALNPNELWEKGQEKWLQTEEEKENE